MAPSKLIFVLGLAVATAATRPALAQHQAGPVTLVTHPLKGGVYWVEGGVCNTGFLVGDKGVIVWDAQETPADARKALAQIAQVTPKPVTHIVLSHGDPDHVGGLPAYPAGIPIIAQENVPDIIQASIADPNGGPLFGPLYQALANLLPTQTVGSRQTVVLDGVRLELLHVGPGHTSADLVAYLPAQKIVFAGDIITTNLGPYPVIHIGGSSLDWIAFLKTILALDADTYVPGHGPIETRAELQARLRQAETRREQIKALVAAHKSLAEVQQALPEKVINPMFPSFTQTTYEELTKGYPAASPPWNNMVHK